MTDLLVKIAIVGPLAAIGVSAMTGLTLLMGAIGTMAVAIGALMDKFPSIQKFLDTGLPVLEQLAGSIGTMIGNFVGGALEGLSDSLPKIGENIAGLMEQLSIASENAAGIDGSSFDGVKQLMNVMGDIGKTTVGMSFADIFTLGGTSMEKFQADGVAFFGALKAISAEATGFSLPEGFSAESINELITVIKDIGKSTVGTTFADIFTLGGTSMEKFEADGKAFFKAMKTISTEATGFTMPEGFSADGLNTLLTAISNIGNHTVGMSFADIFTLGGTSMEKFEADGKAFFKALKAISSEAAGFNIPEGFSADGLNTLLTAISEIGKHTVGTTFADIFTLGGTSMEKFEADGKAFFKAMKNIAIEATGIKFDDGAFQSAIDAAKKLGDLQADIAGLTSVIDFFIQRDDLGTFGTNVGLFADGMKKLKDGMGEDGISEAVVTSVTNAGNAIIALQEALPEEGWFDGKMNLDTFSGYVEKFSTAISTFSTDAANIESEGINTAITAAYKIKNLITALADLDASGVNSFAGVGAGDGHLVNIGQAIGKFGESVADIDIAKVNTAVSVALRLKSLIASLVGLDASGIENFKISSIGKAMKDYGKSVQDMDPGIVSSSISSANRLRNFVASLAGFDSSGVENFKVGSIGTTLKSYSKSVENVDSGKVASSVTAANRLKTFIQGLSGLDSSGVANFKIGTIGSTLKSYSDSVTGINVGSISSSITAATKIKNFISSLAGLNTSGVASFKTAVSTLGQTSMNSITKSFSGSSSKMSNIGTNLITSFSNGLKSRQSLVTSTATNIVNSMIKAISSKKSVFGTNGVALMTQFANGIRSRTSSVVSATTSILSSAVSSTRGYYSSFYSSGSYVASGFASGIRTNIASAANAAASMAAAASAAARANLSIHSPSRVFMKIGSYVPMGFAKGIGMFGGLVKQSVSRMSDNAVNSTQTAMSRISRLLDGDMNTQPTIRPVLDLSDIKSGASAINGMLNGTPTLGVMSRLNAINSMMGERNQNGSMDDVVSAINRLRKDLGNVGGNSYNINGLTYDDGSSISEAVKEIVRAAVIERRI